MRIAAAVAAVFLAFATPALADNVPAAEAGQHVGETATVVGVLTGFHKSGTGKEMYLNIGGTYPDNPFTGVIYIKRMTNPPDFTPIIGKTVAVTGKIKLYHDKPEISINSSDQIQIARDPAPAQSGY